jgi:hypothetical protein
VWFVCGASTVPAVGVSGTAFTSTIGIDSDSVLPVGGKLLWFGFWFGGMGTGESWRRVVSPTLACAGTSAISYVQHCKHGGPSPCELSPSRALLFPDALGLSLAPLEVSAMPSIATKGLPPVLGSRLFLLCGATYSLLLCKVPGPG